MSRVIERALITGISGSGGSYLAEYIAQHHPGVDLPGFSRRHSTTTSDNLAAIRARVRALPGPPAAGDPTWYRWIAPRLFRFGLERPAREVIEEFLGGPVSPAALLEDMRRMGR